MDDAPIDWYVCQDRVEPETGRLVRYYVRGPLESIELAREQLAAAIRHGLAGANAYIHAEPSQD